MNTFEEEELDCANMHLDTLEVPRKDKHGRVYRLVDRIEELQSKILKCLLQVESNLPKTNPLSVELALKPAICVAEYQRIKDTIDKFNGNKSKAAKLLGIDRKTLYNKIDAYKKLSHDNRI